MSDPSVALPLPTNSNSAARADFGERLADAALYGVAFTLPLSTSATEVCVGLFTFATLVIPERRRRLFAACRQPAVAAALALFAWLALSLTWSLATPKAAWSTLLKYRECLYIPCFVAGLSQPEQRRRLWWAFAAGTGIMVVLSIFEYVTRIDIGLQLANLHQWGSVTKDRIQHSILAAFAAYLAAHEVLDDRPRRWLWVTFVVLVSINIMGMVHARTGYLMLLALGGLFCVQRFGWRGILAGAAVGIVGVIVTYQSSVLFRLRMQETWEAAWNGKAAPTTTAVESRIAYSKHSWSAIAAAPLCGTGVGSFAVAYGRQAIPHGDEVTVDPHSEYYMLAVQAGLIGLGLFLVSCGAACRQAWRRGGESRTLLVGVLLTIAGGCLFNSLIVGFCGGLLWALGIGWGLAAAATEETAASTLKSTNSPAKSGPANRPTARAA